MNAITLAAIYRRAQECAHIDGEPDLTLYPSECAELCADIDALLARYRLLSQLMCEMHPALTDCIEKIAGPIPLMGLPS